MIKDRGSGIEDKENKSLRLSPGLDEARGWEAPCHRQDALGVAGLPGGRLKASAPRTRSHQLLAGSRAQTPRNAGAEPWGVWAKGGRREGAREAAPPRRAMRATGR